MAWNAEWMDTFAHYPIARASVLGKWTSQIVTPVAVTIVEDGLQGLTGGTLSKTLSGTRGRIIATRGATTGGLSVETILKCCTDFNDHTIALTVDQGGGGSRVTINLPDGSFITSTQVTIDNGAFYNFELAFLYTGTELQYEAYVDGVKLLDIGSTFATTETPLMTRITTYYSLTFQGLNARSFIATKAYSGSGGTWVANDLYGTVKRGISYAIADGNAPAGEVGRNWMPLTTGGTFTAEIDETLGDEGTSYIITDDNPGETLTPANEATWFMQDSPTDVPNTGLVTDVPHVQVSNLLAFSGATGTVYFVVREETQPLLTVDYHVGPQAITSSFRYYSLSFGSDPRDPAPWTKARLDTLELGVYAYDVL